jgi:putative hydrolase of HD superfamily
MSSDRLRRQIRFILEIDALKSVLRQSYLLRADRRENAAEHSWHVAVMAVLLAEHADEPVDPSRVARMMLIHDIVEVDAGDTYAYDESAAVAREEKERRAADRLFSMLPADQAGELRALWEEFESGRTADARFAAALDRLMPVLHNVHTAGRSWREHGITADRVIARNSRMREGSEALWAYARSLIEDAVAEGHLAPPPDPQRRA